MDQISKEDLVRLSKKLQRENRRLRSEVDRLSAEAPATTSDHRGSDQLLQFANEVSRNKDAEILRLLDRVRHLESSCASLSAENAHLVSTYELQSGGISLQDGAADSAKVEELHLTVRALEDLVRAAEDSARAKDAQLSRLAREVSQARKVDSSWRTAAAAEEEEKEEVRGARAECQKLRLKVADLERLVRECKEQVEVAERQRDLFRDEADGLREKATEMKKQSRESERDKNAKIAALHRKLSMAQSRYSKCSRELQDQLRHVARLRSILKETANVDMPLVISQWEQQEQQEQEQKSEKEDEILRGDRGKRLEEIMAQKDQVILECKGKLLELERQHSNTYMEILKSLNVVKGEHVPQEENAADDTLQVFTSWGEDEEGDYLEVVSELQKARAEIDSLKKELMELERSRDRTHENIE